MFIVVHRFDVRCLTRMSGHLEALLETFSILIVVSRFRIAQQSSLQHRHRFCVWCLSKLATTMDYENMSCKLDTEFGLRSFNPSTTPSHRVTQAVHPPACWETSHPPAWPPLAGIPRLSIHPADNPPTHSFLYSPISPEPGPEDNSLRLPSRPHSASTQASRWMDDSSPSKLTRNSLMSVCRIILHALTDESPPSLNPRGFIYSGALLNT